MLYKQLAVGSAAADRLPGLEQIADAVRERSILSLTTTGRLTKTALHQAVIDGRYRQVKLLLDSGSNVNAKVKFEMCHVLVTVILVIQTTFVL